jgi:Arc/MetJ-type ribon-helix-helix transcriptional regulator
MKTKVTTLRLPEDQAAELGAVARADGVPVSEIVRAAVYQFITARRSETDFKKRLKERIEEDREVLERLGE